MKALIPIQDDRLYDSYVSITLDRDTPYAEACKKLQDALQELEEPDRDFFVVCMRNERDFAYVAKLYNVSARAVKGRYKEIVKVLIAKM